MGMMSQIMGWILGGGGLKDTVEVFRESAEKSAARLSDEKTGAMAQFAAEFTHQRPGVFDRIIDGVNRLPRPMLALGTIGLFVSAMFSPEWFSSRMVGVALIPEPLWWLMGAIVSFYFGSRYQAKGQDFQRSVVETAMLGTALRADKASVAPDPTPFADNAALADWWGQARAE